jgi:hypothetical protein
MWVSVLIGLVQPILARILAALGMGIITYTGTTLLVNQFTQMIQAQLSTTPQVVLQMATLYGLPEAIGIMLGALATTSALSTFKKIGFL